jgi:hypothetical protein
MATLATQSITRAGAAVTPVAAAGGGDKFTPGPNTYLRLVNGSGSSITATVVTQGTDPATGNAIADNPIVIAAGATREAGPWPYPAYAAPADGLAVITYSDVTTLTVAAYGSA